MLRFPESIVLRAAEAAFAAVLVGTMLCAATAVSGQTALDLSYFVGDWTVSIKDNPRSPFSWTVRENLNGEWLVGVVEKDGEEVTRDLWRQKGDRIERHVFTSEGSYMKLTSLGWKSGKMSFTGIETGKAADFRVRETITRIGDRQFRAVWERQGTDGKWSTISDEVCTR